MTKKSEETPAQTRVRVHNEAVAKAQSPVEARLTTLVEVSDIMKKTRRRRIPRRL